jgi:hypothetical protein
MEKDFNDSFDKFVKEAQEVVTNYFTKNFNKSWGKLKPETYKNYKKIVLKEGLMLKTWGYVDIDTGNIHTAINEENDLPGKLIRGNIFKKDTYVNKLGAYRYKI